MNKRLSFVFAALMLVPVALLGQEKAPVQATPTANPITASEKGFYSFVGGAVVAATEMPERKLLPSNPRQRFMAFRPARWPCGRRFRTHSARKPLASKTQ